MKVVAAILAAGKGERFGSDKTVLLVRGRPLWQWSFDTYRNHPAVDAVGVVCSAANLAAVEKLAIGAAFVIPGGATRQESAQLALDQVPGETQVLLLHDAARPFVSGELISRVLQAVERTGAAAPAVPVTDTIRAVGQPSTIVDRSTLRAMQTPQGVRTDLLRRAYAEATSDNTDDLALVEQLGVTPELIPGEESNFKVTTPEDADRARAYAGVGEVRTGIGYDVHSFSDEPGRTLFLGGVEFPDHAALAGHSDADALLHAVVDALLGAAALGDIGLHFPPSEERWKNVRSVEFLQSAGCLLNAAGWRILNIDATVIAESPKIMSRANDIRAAIAKELNLAVDRISIKATTNERLGFIGRGEGIAALAIATIAGA